MANNERLFHIPTSVHDQPYLIGSKCKICSDVHFPPKGACPNCLVNNTLEEIKMGKEGVIRSYSILHVAPSGFPIPHIQAMIKLDEGPLIFSILNVDVSNEIRIGQPVELTIDTIRKGEDGEKTIGWMYKPKGVGK